MLLRSAIAVTVATVVSVVPGCWLPGTPGGSPGSPPPAKAPVVEVGRPVKRSVVDYEEFPGRTEGYRFVEIRPRVSGLLLKQLFKDGEDVDTSQPLFKIDPEPFEADVRRAEAMLEQAEAHRRRLEYDYNRAQANIRKQAISREEFDKIKGDLDEGIASVEIADAALKISQLNLKWTDVTSLPDDQAPESAGTHSRLPKTMRASKRMVDPGNMVQANTTPLTTLIDLENLYITFDIDEPTVLRLRRAIKAGTLKVGPESPVQIQASPADDDSFSIESYVDFSDNALDASSGTLRVRGTIVNDRIPGTKEYLLSPGMFMKVHLRVGEPHDAYLIAEQAVNNDLDRKFVYVIDDLRDKEGKIVFQTDKEGNPTSTPKKTAVARYIKIGKAHDGLIAVEPEDDSWNLDENTPLVVKGMQRVRRGQELAVSRDQVPMGEVGKPPRAGATATPKASAGGNPPAPSAGMGQAQGAQGGATSGSNRPTPASGSPR